MTSYPHGVFFPTYIDSQPLPQVSKGLLPWLIKDRREAEEGGTFKNQKGESEHDKQGLQYAERELRRIQTELALSIKNRDPGDRESDRTAILRRQEDGQQQRVEFWRGKCHLLDRVIMATRALP